MVPGWCNRVMMSHNPEPGLYRHHTGGMLMQQGVTLQNGSESENDVIKDMYVVGSTIHVYACVGIPTGQLT